MRRTGRPPSRGEALVQRERAHLGAAPIGQTALAWVGSRDARSAGEGTDLGLRGEKPIGPRFARPAARGASHETEVRAFLAGLDGRVRRSLAPPHDTLVWGAPVAPSPPP